jgi:hypothetical protein
MPGHDTMAAGGYHVRVLDLRGDICVLISESESNGHRPEWQESLRSRFGGVCTIPIHLTLQRIPADQGPESSKIVAAMRRALSGTGPLTISGPRVEAIHSPFRGSWIAKLRIAATPAVIATRTAVAGALESLGLTGAVPYLTLGQTAPITVLELMNPPDSGWLNTDGAPFVTLDEPPVVRLETVTISRIRAAFDYEIVESWPLD